MAGMDAPLRRTILVIAVLAVAVIAAQRGLAASNAGDPTEIPAATRAAGLTFDSAMTEADRAWVLAAVAAARPEAQRLIDEIDGLVTVTTVPELGDAVGMAMLREDRAEIAFATAWLNGERALDRNVAVLHELGHVVDHFLVSDELAGTLDAGIPTLGTCRSPSADMGPCTAVEERFADTFAKWALGGRVSLAGSGYGIPAPASLETWGSPLGLLALQLDVD
jgi:hypothetical protein